MALTNRGAGEKVVPKKLSEHGISEREGEKEGKQGQEEGKRERIFAKSAHSCVRRSAARPAVDHVATHSIDVPVIKGITPHSESF